MNSLLDKMMRLMLQYKNNFIWGISLSSKIPPLHGGEMSANLVFSTVQSLNDVDLTNTMR